VSSSDNTQALLPPVAAAVAAVPAERETVEHSYAPTYVVSQAQLAAACNNFSSPIGRGGFGEVFSGSIALYGTAGDTAVAVKRFNSEGQQASVCVHNLQLFTVCRGTRFSANGLLQKRYTMSILKLILH
jgi:hypothetical protein